jgi:hypothetical protein
MQSRSGRRSTFEKTETEISPGSVDTSSPNFTHTYETPHVVPIRGRHKTHSASFTFQPEQNGKTGPETTYSTPFVAFKRK